MSRSRNASQEPEATVSPLAIVGMGCRFPGGVIDVESFWNLLTEGRSGIREIPPDRWDKDRFYHPDPAVPGGMITKWGGFVDGVDQFDAAFWGMSPREVLRMDPQQRWLLEVAWEAIEDAGTPPARLRGEEVAVFVGIAATDYGGLQMPFHELIDAYSNSGCTLSIAANRISYMLDLRGPSVSVDTACSSALVAVWQACRSIWSGSATAALAGGVNVIITPHATLGFSKASMLSPSGQCFAFDARANGYVRGEGAGMVYIKPLAQALADGDRIYAVIRGAVANQDGHTSSMTVPGVEGQSAMLRRAYAEARIEPGRVVYMEAHGTGTPVGDPIEATALGRVLSQGRHPDRPCLMGSVKTNIGHLEAGSGIAGLIKAALVLHRNEIPPNRNFEQPNPNIPFRELGLEVVARRQPLPSFENEPPIVGVNSFGFGGTNSHVVLQQAPSRLVKDHQPPAGASSRNGEASHSRKRAVAALPIHAATRPLLLPISARGDAALRGYAESFAAFLRNSPHGLPAICRAAGERKEHHGQRLVVLGQDRDQIVQRLTAWHRGDKNVEGLVVGRAAATHPAVVFVFTGQGAQWWAMGRDLLDREPVFRHSVERIDALLSPLAGWSLIEEMQRSEADSKIDQTEFAQPAIFALQVALAELWQSWGVRPAKVIGHSVGEVAAASVAGVYSLADAVTIIYHRSRLQASTSGNGRMLAAGIPAAEARPLIGADADRVQIAVFNSPNLVTLAGDAEPLQRIQRELEAAGKFNRFLRINYAFHTHQMDPIREELLRVLANIKPQRAQLPFISTVTGGLLGGERLDANYWWQNVRQPVLFAPALANMIRGKEDTFLEIGPHPALASSINECLKEQGKSGRVFHSLKRGADESLEMLTNAAGLHCAGVDFDWAALTQGSPEFVRLPGYPWARESYWLESAESRRGRLTPLDHPLLGIRISAALPTWQFDLHPARFAYLNDHRFWDSAVFPGAGFAEMGLALARLLFPDDPHAVEEVQIVKALFISADEPPTVQVVFDPSTRSYSVFGSKDDKQTWELHAHGKLARVPVRERPPLDVAALRSRLTQHFDHDRYYGDMDEAGYQFGPNFREVQNVWYCPKEALAEIVAPPDIVATLDEYHFHPALLDACLHVFKGLKPNYGDPKENFYLPHSFRRVNLFVEQPPARLWAYGKLLVDDGRILLCDIFIHDEAGRPVGEILQFRGDKVEQKRAPGEDLDDCYYQFRWQPRRLRGQGIAGPYPFAAAEPLIAAVSRDRNEVHARHDLEHYHRDYVPAIEPLIAQSIQNAWLELGWRPGVGATISVPQAKTALGVADGFEQLLRAHLQAMATAGIVKAVNPERWEIIREPHHRDVKAPLEALAAAYPRFAPEVTLHRMIAPQLAAVLAGRVDPVSVLFPGGNSEALERFYVSGADFPALAELLQTALRRILDGTPSGRILRVLEVGAGTGSMTRVVLPVLPADRTEYTFTDVGPAFVTAAKKTFADYPFIEYRTFDLDKDPAAQGIEPGSYDLILGSLVLHTTADLRRTLTHLRGCLADGGLLMFSELFARRHAWDCIFGLLKGWWRFADMPLRTHSPTLEPDQWKSLLAETGFGDITSFGTSPDPSRDEQAIFVGTVKPTAAASSAPQTPVSSEAGKTFLLVPDQGGVAAAIADRLREHGHRVVELDIASAALPVPSEEIAGLIHAASLDHPLADGLTLDALWQSQQSGALNALRLIQSIGSALPPCLWFLVRDVVRVRETDRVQGLASAPLIGFLRVANNEYFPTRFAVIDVGDLSSLSTDDLVQEMIAGDEELEVAYRAGRRFAPRLGHVRPEQMPVPMTDAIQPNGEVLPYRLQIERPGILTNLSLNRTRRRDPADGEIEVRVRAGGINFRDVMKALGTYPGYPIDLLWFGDDFAGVIERVGPGVTHLKAGDRVAGMAPYSFRSFSTFDARMAFRIPNEMTFEEAATLPTVFLTAHYALVHLARLEPGEKVLIHAGTGGVGQAAIQVAQRLGLEIFATAGSADKRQMLRDMGVHHVMNSRTLEFADEVMEITAGHGVDAVLNSLAGDFIPKSISVLAPFGRFLEIGKVDIYRNSKLGLESLRNNISYFVIDLAQHLLEKPSYVARLFAELQERFATGEYRPLPRTVFPITQVTDAFRHMAQGKHVGKNVLSFDVPEIKVGPNTEDGQRFDPNGSFLITGGAGGFGLEVAKWLAGQGARHLVLMSRSGPRDEAVAEIERLRQNGVAVWDARGDAANRDDVDRVLAQVRSTMPPLRGVIHAAMVLDDDFIANLDESRFRTAMTPKMAAAWNLHAATLGDPLDCFICFSSVSSLVGVPKQSNYNAGNYFLDALAHHRRAAGLPALTINWAPLAGAGYVERTKKTADFLGAIGLKALRLDESLRVLAAMTQRDAVQVGAVQADWRSLARATPTVGRSPVYASLVGERSGGDRSDSAAARLRAASADARPALVEEFIVGQVASVFGVAEDKIDREAPLNTLGLDSLMAVELTNRIEREIGVAIPMGALLGGPSVKALAPVMLRLLAQSSASGDDATAVDSATTTTLLPMEKVTPAREEFPLSEGQQAIWFLYRLEPDSPAYNLTFAAKFRPLVDIAAMRRAFAKLFELHPMLDVAFAEVDGVPVQRLRRGRTIDFREHDVTELNDDELKQLLIEHGNRPFDLERGRVTRLELFRTRDDAHVAMLSLHHIVADAWSVVVMINDLIEAYFAYKSGQQPEFKPRPYTYQDFVAWETKHLAGPAGKKLAEYWKRTLRDAPLQLDLPTDRPRRPVPTTHGGTVSFRLDEDLTRRTMALAAEQNVTLFSTLLATFEALMHRWCHQDDLVVGCPMAGRYHPELYPTVGYFINPAPIRSQSGDDPTFAEFLTRTAQQAASAIEHQPYPFPRLVRDLNVARDASRPPVFQVSFSMERIPGFDEQGVAVFLIGQGGHHFYYGDLSAESVDLTLRQAQFEITLVVEEAGGNIYGCWQYNRDLFEPQTIERLNELYARVLRDVTRDPLKRLSDIDLLSDRDRATVLGEWNATAAALPTSALVHELFERQAMSSPKRPAVRSGNESWTHAQLNARANGIAALLRDRGIGPDVPVGVLARRTPGLVAALLGVLKAGGCYVPMDPDYPAARLRQMVENAAPRVILVSRDLKDGLPVTDASILIIDDISGADRAPAVPELNPDHLAYIIYTSGSTGTPKGVEIPHAAAANFLASMAREPGFEAGQRLLAVTTLSFDIAFLELFLPLTTGGEVCLVSRDDARDGRRLAAMIEAFDIAVMQATPATWRLMLEAGWNGRRSLKVLCGGEALPADLANALLARVGEVWNVYGPTETTVWSACTRLDPTDDGPITIGRPIANTVIYVLDDQRRPVPAGMTGELYIGGRGLARGYHGRPDLTAERFVNVDIPGVGVQRLYRTGDLGLWMLDGRLRCLGRIDQQVKIRGHRIELEEIELALKQHPDIRDAVVQPFGLGTPDARLVAYLVTSESPPALVEWQRFLRERLPEFMIPTQAVVLETIPQTPNGKIDRRALPEPDRRSSERRFVEPRTETERLVATAWSELLGVDRVGAEDDFFELGGHSLAAARLVARLRSEFGLELPLAGMMQAPTVAGAARLLDAFVAGEELPVADAIDFAAEATLDADITPRSRIVVDPTRIDRLLLTGATGFLGAFLLDELLRETSARILCLVRASSDDDAMRRIEENLQRYELPTQQLRQRVTPIVGDLELPQLGLSDAAFDRLANGLDAIYHNGAFVNLFLPYSRLRAANVGGTREVLRLAARGRPTPVHFVSTFSVLAAGSNGPAVSEDDPLPKASDLPDGYTQSKWVGEQLVQQARLRGIPVTIYRPGHITGHSRTGVCNPQDFLHSITLACTRIGVVPALDGRVDVTPVDYVSRAIVRLSRDVESQGGTFHLVNPTPLELPELVDWLKRSHTGFDAVPYRTWRERLESLVSESQDDPLAPLLGVLGNDRDHGDGPRWHPDYDCQQAVSRLSPQGIVCPRPDDELLATYWRYSNRSGAIPAARAGNGEPRPVRRT